jgi:hypothetical protein
MFWSVLGALVVFFIVLPTVGAFLAAIVASWGEGARQPKVDPIPDWQVVLAYLWIGAMVIGFVSALVESYR